MKYKEPSYWAHGPWGRLERAGRKKIIEDAWESLNEKEKKTLQNVATWMNVRSLGLKGVLSLIVSLWMDERTRETLEKGYFGQDTIGKEEE